MDSYGTAWSLLQRTRRRVRALRVQTVLLAALAPPPLVALGFVLAEQLGDHSSSHRHLLRSVLLGVLAVWGLAWLALALWGWLGRRWLPEERATALALGAADDEVRDRLLNGLEVIEAERRRPGSFDPELVAASLDHVLPRLERVELTRVLPLAGRRRAAWRSLAVWLAALGLFLAGGETARLSASRLAWPEREFRGAPLFRLKLVAQWPDPAHPGRLLAGQSLDLQVLAEGGALPSEVELSARGQEAGSARGEDARWRLPLRHGRARLEGFTPRGSLQLRASALEEQQGQLRRLESPALDVLWLRPPALDSLAITVHPPAYTGLAAFPVPPGAADFRAPAGSRVDVKLHASGPLRAAWLQVEGDSAARRLAALGLERTGATGSFTARGSLAWSARLLDGHGLENPHPLVHQQEVVPDQPPRLRVLAPQEAEGRLDPSLALPLALLAEDDYGFGPLRLAWTVRGRALREAGPPALPTRLDSLPRGWSRRELTLTALRAGAEEGAGRRAAAEERWDLAPLDLMPDDELAFFFELWDNDGWNGPKAVRSPLFLYRMPGLDELFAESREDSRDLEKEAEELVEKARDNTKRMEELRDELRREPEMTWERQQRLKEVVRQQEELSKQAAKLANKVEQTQGKMESRNLLSAELRQKLSQLKQLLDEAMSPELLDKLRKASEEAMRHPQAKAENKPAGDMEELLRKMEQQLDRFLAVLQQMKLEQRLEELAQRAEALLEQQRQLDRDPASPKEKAASQQAQQENAERLAKDVEALREEFGQRPDFPAKELEQASKQLAEKKIPPRLGEMGRQMEQGQRPSEGSQQEMDQDLNQLADQLQQALQQSRQQAMAQLDKEIDRICQELLTLSQRQEAVGDGLAGLAARSARLGQLADETLENQLGVRASSRSVLELTRKSLHISPAALGELGAADLALAQMLDAFHERSLGRLGQLSPDAMGRINRAILLLKDSQRKMNSSSSSSGFQELMEQMAAAAARQQCLNGQCSNLLGAKPGQSQKPMSISFGEAQGEQGSIRKDLEGLQEKLGQEGKPQLGDLGQAASDMREVEKDLAAGTYTERTQKLQERIASRLLDAQRSVRRQDEEKKRESRSAAGLRAKPPAPLELQKERALERELQRALQGDYRPEMQELIRDYFRALEAQEPASP